MTERTNTQWRLAARPEGLVKDSDFEWREEPVPSLDDGQLLVRNVYLSLDPTNRVWMNASDSYLPAIQLGEVMRGGTIGVVEESQHGKYQTGDLVAGTLGWQMYSISDGRGLTKVPRFPGLELTAGFAVFGHIGVTAYFGLMDIGQPKAGETLVVSAAAGAVGSLVGQIGKIQGCRVVGLAGTDEKCAWITDELGFDAAINYKTEEVPAALRTHCPDGIDIYFENVGGEIFDAVVPLLNIHARVPVCGLISQYTSDEMHAPPPYLIGLLIQNRIKLEGFLVLDYMDRHDECAMALGAWLTEGKLKYKVDVVDGLKNAPQGLNRLFEGANTGKLLVQVSDEPPA